jgi:amino acid adenylation domain-containing protein
MPARPGPGTYTRRIAASEWWMLAHPLGLSMDIQMCVEGDGDIDPAALSAAVASASAACPGARLTRRGRRWVDSGEAPPVHVTNAADFDRARLDSPLLRKRMAHRGEPSSEVLLVRGSPATVVFRAEHATMDAAGVVLWQRDVFRALRGEAAEGADSRLTRDEVMQEIAGTLDFDPLPGIGPESWPPWQSLLTKIPRGPRQSIWRRRAIDGTHPASTAKIMRAVAAFGQGNGLLAVSVDMRPYFPGTPLRTTTNASAVIQFRVRGDEDWTDVHTRLLTGLRTFQFLNDRGNPKVLMVPLPLFRARRTWWDNQIRKNDDIVRDQQLFGLMAGVSHLGTAELADVSCDGFAATSCYSLGATTLVPEISVVECGGRTEVTLGWRDGPGVAGRAEALLDRIEEELSPRAYRVWEGNQTSRDYPAVTLTGLFAGQAAATPDALAVAGPAGELTYAQLAARAAAVSAALTGRGIGRGDRVGLVAGRTPAAIAAIWGILGAGAAYLPIDAGYPGARITALLTDAAAPACLLQTPAGHDVVPPGCQAIALDTLPPAPPGVPWPVPGITPADLACVIYTSGSTGTPKGVEIEHASLVNYVRWATREAGIDATAKMPLIASISFDMAGCALYLPLLAGGTVLPVPDVNAAALRQIIEDHDATHMAITPSHLDLINQSGIRRSAMRVIMTAGELLRRSTALRALDIFGPDCAILCQWGPTETTIVNTSHRFDPGTDTSPGVPFGRPMDNNTIYLLDTHGRFVAPGEPGEACVAGIQVARGYLGRPDLTRRQFTHLADGTRVYRTGDIARLLPAGDLAFISRADNQVKIAGHRIEPAEITQALENHPHVRQAAVIPRTRPGRHDKELCGYVVTSHPTTPADLKDHLTRQLPRYMIPAVILTVPEIPRTPNGKTDPRQLPDPFAAIPRHQPPPPGDDITAAITSIWARTLQIDPATLDEHADFHQLGGNSILMLTMLNEISRTIPGHAQEHLIDQLPRIIRQPTISEMSKLVRRVRIAETDPAN